MNAAIDISRVCLRTERLTLRPWRESDLPDFYEYARVDGVGQMAGWNPHRNMEESRVILESFLRSKKTFALEYGGKVVGSLGIEEYSEENYPELSSLQGREIGYVLSKDCWGLGLMPEAVKAVLRWLFGEEKLDFVLVGHFDWNRQSRRVVEKCGFRYIKTVKYETRYDTVENSVEYILYREERRTPMLTHKGTQTIETSRLILRRALREDAEPMFRNWASDPEVTKYLTWPTYETVETAFPILDMWIEAYEKPDFYQWMIVPKALGEPIGSISVVRQNEPVEEAEIGYCIGRQWWHQGIMSEALKAVMDYLFAEVGMNRVASRHDPNNPHSGGVMRKCGMVYEGTARSSDRNNQGICDAAHYAILRSDWERRL